MRFAFVTDELPQPGLAGHLAMNHAMIAWLQSRGHQVTVFLLRPRLNAVVERFDAAGLEGIGIKIWRGYVFAPSLRAASRILARQLFAALPGKTATRIAKGLRSRQYGSVDTVLGAFITPAQTAWCIERLLQMAPDAIFADTIFRAPLLREPALAGFRSVVIAQDVFHLRHRALLSAGYTVYPKNLTRQMEAELLNSAGAIAAIQPEEAAEIAVLCPGKTICTAPMPALPCLRPASVTKIPDRLVFVGSAALPNLDGLRWLFAQVWPRLRNMLPAVTLDVVGNCGNAFPVLPPGVTRLGLVADLSPVLHRSALAIAPMHVGSGLKIKILDYARHGLVTVGTTESLQGFAADANAPFIATSDADGFAVAILAMLQNPDPARETAALNYVTQHYSLDASYSGLATVLGI